MTLLPPIDLKKGPGSVDEHQRLVAQILLKFGSNHKLKIWKNATGTGKSHDGKRFIRYGLKGSADIIGIMEPNGKFIAIEVKTGNAKQSKQQKIFEQMVTKSGGIYIVARSVQCVSEALHIAQNM